VLGILFALPNLYGDDPAVQVSKNNATLTDTTTTQVEQALDTAKLPYKSAAIADNRLVVRFSDTDTQLRALDVITKALGNDYSVALNLVPRTPKWMRAIGLKPMAKGLDLQGGVHFQLLIDLDAAIQTKLQRDATDIRSSLREKLIRYTDVSLHGNAITLTLRTPDDVSKAKQFISSEYPELT